MNDSNSAFAILRDDMLAPTFPSCGAFPTDGTPKVLTQDCAMGAEVVIGDGARVDRVGRRDTRPLLCEFAGLAWRRLESER